MNNIQNNLVYLLKDCDVKAWCSKHNIAYRTVQDIRHGKCINIKLDTLLKLSDALNITIDKLVKANLSGN